MTTRRYVEMYDGFGAELRPGSTVIWAGDVYRVLAFCSYGTALVMVRADDPRGELVYAAPHETELVHLVDNNPNWIWWVDEQWIGEPEISMRHVGGRFAIIGNDEGELALLDYENDDVDSVQAVTGMTIEQLMALVDD
jgi:hypothetical protein